MAGVLEHLIVRVPLPRKRDRPWSRPRARIVDRHLVLQRVRVDEPETLGQLDRFARSSTPVATNTVPAVEIRCLDDQRVAVPAAARIPHIALDRLTCVRAAIEWNN